MEIPSELLSQDFWLDLRKQTTIGDELGEKLCSVWSHETYRLLDNRGYSDFFQIARLGNPRNPKLRRLKLTFHKWLEIRDGKKRIFIADGTAGQIFPNYPMGFYGMVNTMNRDMMIFYCSMAENYVPEENLEKRIIRERNREYSPVYFR